ncbi:alanine or glycine:cation symporter, AGCS family [Peptoniphilus asaccharolyticus DSM 20463]|uniref:Alanine or glycine:cation symporter, AGCS family n=1 Tax=Peptoniphilus asaccharolyticus DSM 20463 TaxID=573058 RepID=A0A1W1V623_PEPAS|nr:amino acid carrier protein [Peptoniphilus asaccharolyticus]MBL7576375.1 sodium:alanine symporter family protein [Peptoniphilus asaccharolyticus]SMB88630.1 alanine or glycine:cation symporter, AGCS family [Peptoniphilus asaccharolyticus DSM 20463]
MENLIKLISDVTNAFWGWPILIVLLGGGLIVCVRTGFVQIRYLPFILKQTFGKMFSSNVGGEGSVSPFQAATAALASSIGAANIVVAPSIIFTAGPGVIFWMWIAGLIGQATKFGEIILGIKYREKNVDGEYVGGPAYTFKKGIGGTLGKIMGFLVSFFFMIEILPSITLQTISAAAPLEQLGLSRVVSAVVIAVLVILVAYGGIKRIAQVTEKMVPIMAATYIIAGLIVIIMHIDKLPGAFGMIIYGAFNPKAVVGGAAGAGIAQLIRAGAARGCYSNEAGMGSAPYAHATAVTDHPCRQGMWGIFEVIADTMIVCTISALVVLVTGLYQNPDMKDIGVERAFNAAFGQVGTAVVAISLFLFVLSTIIVIVFYAEKQGEYLFGTTIGKVVRFIACGMVILGGFVSFDNAGVFLDATLGLVVFTNMVGMIMLSGELKELVDEFFKDPKYYPGAKK